MIKLIAMKKLIAPITCMLILSSTLLGTSQSAQAKNYQTLPQGRSTLGYKYVVTETITHKLDDTGNRESYSIKENIDSTQLETINTLFSTYFETLKSLSPEAYNAFSFGEYSVHAEGNVKAQGIGMGHGFTNKLTGYFALPLYQASSSVNLKQTKFSNMQAVKDAIQGTNPTDPTEILFKQFTEQVPEASGEVLQSLVTNYYGYKPLGNWRKTSPGDLEIGFIYNIVNESVYGTAFGFGAVLPTGTPDDPDSLQDISSGDGQTDLFIENFSGVSLVEGIVDLDLRSRYVHQLKNEKYMRLPDNENFPLSYNKGFVDEKLGDKMEGELTLTTTLFDSFSQSIGVLYSKKMASRYETEDLKAKQILEKNTEEQSTWLKAGVKFSTIELFKKNKFFLPMDIGGSYQTLLNGKNTPDYHRIDIDLRLYF